MYFNDIKKKPLILSLIIFFMVFGFYLRAYHMDVPSIGYHNMKENEYLSQASLQAERGEWLRRPMHIFGAEDQPYFEEYPQMPILPWMFRTAWFFTGESTAVARFIIILFSIVSIPLMYSLGKKLTKSDMFALTTALLFTILPLGVYFGRNIQPEAPALASAILAMLAYLYYLDNYENKHLLVTALALAFTGLLKPTFLILLIPMAALAPWHELKNKEWIQARIKQLPYILPLLIIPLWMFISGLLNTRDTLTEGTFTRVNLFQIFTNTYWDQHRAILTSYVADNFTWFLFYVALVGILLALYKHKTKLGKFTAAYAFAVIPYFMILADYIKAHNYYQYPFLPLACLAIAYVLYFLGSLLKQITKIPFIQYAALLILLIPMGDVQAAVNRQHDTLFYGLDVVAEYIDQNAAPDEKFWLLGHAQSVGACYNSGRYCDSVWWDDFNRTVQDTEEKNFRYIFIHGPPGLQSIQSPIEERPQLWEWMQNNYRIRLIGMGPRRQPNGQLVPEVFLLERGGTFDLNTLNTNAFSQRTHYYETTDGRAEMLILEDNS